jgi:methylmalonyl-CoA mutase N-terminal domain/subunit
MSRYRREVKKMFEKDKLDEIRVAQQEWESRHLYEFAQESKKEFITEDGIPIRRIYTPLDLEEKGFDFLNDVGFPGELPYTRGITSTMYRTKPWKFVQYSGRATPEESNELWKRQLAEGANAVVIANDLPTQLGYDPDHPMVQGEVGRTGAPISSLRDWEVCFDGIDIENVGVRTVCNAPVIFMVASHIALAEQRGVNISKLQGCAQNDILKEYIARGNYIFPPEPSVRLAVDVIAYLASHCSMYQCDLSSVHVMERGANKVQQIAWGISDAITYLESAAKREVGVDKLAPAMNFISGMYHNEIFAEVAKFRANRKLWARILKERFHAKDPRSWLYRTWIVMGGVRQLKQQPLNNIARSEICSLIAGLSGGQDCEVKSYNEAIGIPTPDALTGCLRYQQIAAYEAGITDTIDPFAGSYYVEWLTKEFEERAIKEIERIDQLGGMIKAIEKGYPQSEMTKNAYQYQKKIESGEVVQVGLNKYYSEPTAEEKAVRPYRAKPELEDKTVAKIRELRRNRDNAKVKQRLDNLLEMARTDENLVPPVIEAVKVYATVGEICDVFREVYGVYTPLAIW